MAQEPCLPKPRGELQTHFLERKKESGRFLKEGSKISALRISHEEGWMESPCSAAYTLSYQWSNKAALLLLSCSWLVRGPL